MAHGRTAGGSSKGRPGPGGVVWLTTLGVALGLGSACSDGQATLAKDPGQTGGRASSGGGEGGAPAPEGGAAGEATTETGGQGGGTTTGGTGGSPTTTGGSDAGGNPGVPTCVSALDCDDGPCVLGFCRSPGDGDEGSVCASDLDCGLDLRCEAAGITGACRPQGDGEQGDGCARNTECVQGLYCLDGSCEPRPPGSVEPWSGVDCEPLSDDEPVRAYFEVPGAEGALEHDFFRLPFPNDARRSPSGSLDLSGFPDPGPGPLGFDPVSVYTEAIQDNDRDWGTDPTVIFRFSNGLDTDSLKEDDRVWFVDITPDTPEYGQQVGWQWWYSGGRTAYVCEASLSVLRPMGAPLLPGHVYTVYVSAGLLDANGEEVTRSDNLDAVLADDPPDDAVLADVHDAYAPLRDYLADQDIDPDEILTATVITAGQVLDTMTELSDTIESEDAPTASDWVLCDDGVDSPCPQNDPDLGRGCEAANPAFDEYHALVELPIFQEGTPPYLLPEDGGGVVTDAPVRTEEVCLSLTVPRSTMPDDGWPLVVYADGTGGSFRGHVRSGVSAMMSSVPVPGNGTVEFAVLGIDPVVHGSRRGTSDENPELLFFNFSNPASSRGNPLQGAVDQLALSRFAADLDVSVDGNDILIDPDRMVFFGHSQGSMAGSLMLPYADRYQAAVLSGNGASLREALITKTDPVNIAAALPFALSDPSATGDAVRFHPVLGLVQQWIDPADPLNFARVIAREPIEPHEPHSVFQTYGLGDTYSPPTTLQTFSIAAGLRLVETSGFDLDEIGGQGDDPDALLAPAAAPLFGNLNGVTAGVREYEPGSGQNGHFVVFQVAQASEDAARFLAMAVSGLVPEIGE